MKTAYYTFTIWDDGAVAAGSEGAAAGTRRAVMVRQSEEQARAVGGENVIDLNAWRAAELCLPQEEDRRAEPSWDDEDPELVLPAPRQRRRSRRALSAAELVSTLSVAAAAAAIVLRVLTF